MILKFNGAVVTAPSSFKVTINDIDDGDTTERSANGTLNRDRIAVKRQIDVEWGLLKSNEISLILSNVSGIFFTVNYPDPQLGQYTDKTFYASNKPALAAIDENGEILWSGLSFTLIEK